MKKYNFDYLKNYIDDWTKKSQITRQWLNMLPFGLYEYSYPPKDINGDTIENFDDWYNQRTEYLDNLIEQMKT